MKKNMDKKWVVNKLTAMNIHYYNMMKKLSDLALHEEDVNLRAEYLRLYLKYGELESATNTTIWKLINEV